jgi:hypothetical protein
VRYTVKRVTPDGSTAGGVTASRVAVWKVVVVVAVVAVVLVGTVVAVTASTRAGMLHSAEKRTYWPLHVKVPVLDALSYRLA